MPGLIGVTIGDQAGQSVVTRMQDLVTHLAFHIRDTVFSSLSVSASRVHAGTVQLCPQPARAVNGIFVWLDGEIYNASELSARLRNASTESSDADLLAQMYLQDDTLKALKEVDGVFSAVIFDSARRRIKLITDRYGLRHLYWLCRHQQLAWSSEPKAFLALPGFTPKISEEVVPEFFQYGYLLEDHAWFENVHLLNPGTVLDFALSLGTCQESRYWTWDSIKPIVSIQQDEAVHELARRFSQAVAHHAEAGVPVGVSLSGGLDSRALLAAMPNQPYSIHAVTFGRSGCDDVRIAAMAAGVKGASHHVVELNEANWLQRRIPGVWFTDGQNDLGHMHALVSVVEQRKYFAVNLNGYLGDAILGGWYQDDPKWSLCQKIDNRGRRFINEGTRLTNNFVHNRLPFFDNRLMEFTYALPGRLKAASRLYCRMLLATFPDYFRSIPWQKTGVPISRPQWWSSSAHLSRRIISKLQRNSARLRLPVNGTRDYASYPEWLRRGTARVLVESLLMNPNALYPQFISADKVRKSWANHVRGADRSSEIFRALTFELWLQQVFEGGYRTEQEDAAEFGGRKKGSAITPSPTFDDTDVTCPGIVNP